MWSRSLRYIAPRIFETIETAEQMRCTWGSRENSTTKLVHVKLSAGHKTYNGERGVRVEDHLAQLIHKEVHFVARAFMQKNGVDFLYTFLAAPVRSPI